VTVALALELEQVETVADGAGAEVEPASNSADGPMAVVTEVPEASV
jgi:hypothetical protein